MKRIGLQFKIQISLIKFQISNLKFQISPIACAGSLVRSLLALALLVSLGCDWNIGKGGTGELVVSRQKLREIRPLELEEAKLPATSPSTTEPTTQSLTRPSSAPTSQPTPVEVFLSLADIRRLALENNLDLKVEFINPTLSRQQLSEAEAAYEAVFTTSLNYASTDSATASRLESAQSETWGWNSGLSIPLRTGGNITLGVPLNRGESNNAFSTLNPAYTAGPTASLSLPLLRGFGIDYNAQRIRVAFYAYETAQANTKLQVIRVLADAERAYWRVYAAREALKLREAQKKLAVAQYDRAERQAKQQLVADIDVLRAASGVADAEEQIIIATKDFADRQRELKRIINSPTLDLGGPELIIAADRPAAVAYQLDGPQLITTAMRERMELLETELAIAQEVAQGRIARNELLPLVTLNYTYGLNGLGASLDDAVNQARRADFQNHSAGISVEVPIGNEAARSRYRQSLYRRLQQLATKEQRQLQIRQEVFTSVDNLRTTWQRIQAARKRVELAARVFDGERRQNEQGRRTSTEVDDALTKLADARQSEIAAVAEYQIAQIDIAVATGMLLGRSHVAWQPTVKPEVEGRRQAP